MLSLAFNLAASLRIKAAPGMMGGRGSPPGRKGLILAFQAAFFVREVWNTSRGG